jgi:hypothetical protein
VSALSLLSALSHPSAAAKSPHARRVLVDIRFFHSEFVVTMSP